MKCPTPVKSLDDLQRYYTDDEGSKIDPKLKQQLQEAVEPCVTFVSNLAKWSDNPTDESLALFDEWITTWADANAYLGSFDSKQSQYQRKWDLCGIAIAYYKVKKQLSEETQAKVNEWIIAIAHEVIAFFDDPSHKHNNQYYWAGLAVGVIAIAVADEEFHKIAKDIFNEASEQVTDEGFLPLELARKTMALHYHCFACMALVPLSLIPMVNNEVWNTESLERLIKTTIDGINDPQKFADVTGMFQNTDGFGAGWVQLANKLYGVDFMPDIDQKHRWLGGDIMKFYEHILENKKV